MVPADLLIRPARRSDAAALAVLIDIAGEGVPAHLWAMMKSPGQSVFEFGRSRAARDSGGFSWRNATIVEIDDEVVAMMVDYRLDDPYQADAPDEVPDIVRPLIRLESQVPGSWYINVLATLTEFRGRGIGSRLLALAEQRAARAGAKMLSLIVADKNEGASLLYARTGYVEKTRAPIVTFPGFAHGGDWVLLTKPVPSMTH